MRSLQCGILKCTTSQRSNGTMGLFLKAVLFVLVVFLAAACGEAMSPGDERPPTTSESSAEEKVLTILYWQAPSLPGPYLASGYKDRDAGAVTSRMTTLFRAPRRQSHLHAHRSLRVLGVKAKAAILLFQRRWGNSLKQELPLLLHLPLPLAGLAEWQTGRGTLRS